MNGVCRISTLTVNLTCYSVGNTEDKEKFTAHLLLDLCACFPNFSCPFTCAVVPEQEIETLAFLN